MKKPAQFALKELPDDVLKSLFEIYVTRPELPWLEKCWGLLAKAGLTTCRNAAEKNAVLGRLVVLAYIYRRWAEAAYEDDCGVEDRVEKWHSEVPFVRNPAHDGLPACWHERAESDLGEHRLQCMLALMDREYDAVFKVLMAACGDGGEYVLADDLRHACGRPDHYDHANEPSSEWEYGEELLAETGKTPKEMDSMALFNDRFYLGL